MKHLLKHFKTLTKHPKNAEELKGLILQLAIQGKLTENWRQENPNVEPASELLERIKAEKQKLIINKEIKKEKLEPINFSTELPFAIPEDWELLRLGNTMSIIRGVSFKKHEVSEVQTKGTIGVLRGQNMVNSEINKNKLIYFSRDKVKESQIISKGDIAITLSSGSDKLVGKIGLSNYDEEFTIGAFYGKLKVFDEKTKFYILNYLDSPLYKNQLKGAFRGIGINNLSNSKVKNLIIPIPPLEEQKAIVAIVNELFKEVEQLEDLTKTRIQLKADFVTSALQRLTEADNLNQEWQLLQNHFTEFFTEKGNIKQLRDTILQLAVQGKLTAKWRSQNPNTEPASELLKRIQTKKQELIAQKKIKKEKPLPPIEDHEKPYELPEGWVWCRLGDISSIRVGATPKREVPEYWNGTIPWVSSGEVANNFILDTKEKITEKGYSESSVTIYPAGTVLVAMIGQGKTRGQTSILKIKAGTNQNVGGIIIFHNYLISEYLWHYFLGRYEKTRSNAVGGNQPAINGTKLKMSVFGLPPLEEQKAIVKQVIRLMALCDSLEEQIENSQTQIEQLMQSCLREVFENNK